MPERKARQVMPNNKHNWYKENPKDTIWWLDTIGEIGVFVFSFDKKRIFNLFEDYPFKLTVKEKEIFDKENPYWADFFKDRTHEGEYQD